LFKKEHIYTNNVDIISIYIFLLTKDGNGLSFVLFMLEILVEKNLYFLRA